jgi:hypothetical protein
MFRDKYLNLLTCSAFPFVEIDAVAEDPRLLESKFKNLWPD